MANFQQISVHPPTSQIGKCNPVCHCGDYVNMVLQQTAPAAALLLLFLLLLLLFFLFVFFVFFFVFFLAFSPCSQRAAVWFIVRWLATTDGTQMAEPRHFCKRDDRNPVIPLFLFLFGLSAHPSRLSPLLLCWQRLSAPAWYLKFLGSGLDTNDARLLQPGLRI